MNSSAKAKNSFAAVAVFVAASLSACGGGGGSSGTATPAVTTLTGSVLAPTSTLALLEHKSLFERMLAGLIPSATAQSGSGLVPVPNTNILVFQIDNSGTPTGSVIAQTKTDANGNWTLNLPAGTSLGSNLVAQATASNTPRAVGQPNQQNCPATTTTIGLTPATEYATRALINGIARNASNLGNFTNSEVNAIIARVIAIAQDPSLVGATIEETINKITAVADPETRRNIDGAAASGEAAAPQGLGGVYNVVAFSANNQGNSQDRGQEIGTVSIDVSAKTFAVNTTETRAQLSETCTATATAPCARSFVRSARSQNNTEGGSISLLGGNQIAFQDKSGGGGVLGTYNASGDLIVIPSQGDLIIAIKQTSSAPPLTGNYQAAELNSSLSSNFNVVQGTAFSTGNSGTALDSVTISGSSLNGTGNETRMDKQITCNGTTPSGACSNTESLTKTSKTNSFSAAVAVSNSGVLTVTPSQGSALPGAVSGDGNFFVLDSGHPDPDGDAGIVFGVKQGSGLSNASLNGPYNFASLELDLGANSNSVRSGSGTVNLDGNGNLSASLIEYVTRVSSICNAGACPSSSVSTSSRGSSPTATYTVTSTGAVTLAGTQSSTISGYASPDGRIIVLTSVEDGTIGSTTGPGESNRGLFVLIKK